MTIIIIIHLLGEFIGMTFLLEQEDKKRQLKEQISLFPIIHLV